ncbi:YtpI family protein [Paenibacillus sp. P26]|nr:YtpI family protein [Paenibacillus sp. P26]
MLQTVQYTLGALIVITLLISVYYSYRYRRESDPKRRGLYASRMNIAMGVMLIFIAVTQPVLLHRFDCATDLRNGMRASRPVEFVCRDPQSRLFQPVNSLWGTG